MPTVKQEIEKVITRWEGGFQAMPGDRGNWVNGNLVGTMRGVTPLVLAAHRGIPVETVTQDMMKSVTLEEAVDIGESLFYKGTGLDRLPWGPATSVLVDVGWGSGPHQACLFAQRLAGLTGGAVDGRIGPQSVEAYTNWIRKVGWKAASQAVADMRGQFYRNLGQPQFLQGWLNRTAWGSPENAEWWAAWEMENPALPEPYSAGGGESVPKPMATASIPAAAVQRDSNTGLTLTGATTLLGATAPLVASVAGDWKVAIVFGIVAMMIGAGLLIYLLRIKNNSNAQASLGG